MTDEYDITGGLDLLGDWLDAKGYTEEAGLCTRAMDEITRTNKNYGELSKEIEALRAENARLQEAVIKERETAAMIVEGFCTAMNNSTMIKILSGSYKALVDRDFAIAAAIREGVKDTLADLRAARAAMGETE